MFNPRVAILLLFLALPAHAATLFVSPDGTASDGLSWETAFPTIGEAIVASTTGDEVWIRSGTYEENLVIQKPLTILGGFDGTETLNQREQRDPESNVTIVDGNQNGSPVIRIVSTNAVLEGAEIVNGLSYSGSGIHISDSSATLREMTLFRNGHLDDSEFGGAVVVSHSQCRIYDCRMNNNSAVFGGGISIDYSTVHLISTILSENLANQGGGIMLGSGTTVEMISCMLGTNEAVFDFPDVGQIGFGGQGSAIYQVSTGERANLFVTNSIFRRNTFANMGSGSVFYGKGQFTAEFDQCTCIVGAETTGFGVFRFSSLPVLRNCIVVSEPNGSSTPIGTDDAIVSHSLVEGGYPGEGNIDAHPKFVDISGGDYHLQRGSPCIDSGTDTGVMVDFDGNPRPVGDYDMGAYEFPYLRSDLNGDGTVGPDDLLIFQQDWGKVPGP